MLTSDLRYLFIEHMMYLVYNIDNLFYIKASAEKENKATKQLSEGRKHLYNHQQDLFRLKRGRL